MKPLKGLSEVVFSVARMVVGFTFCLHGVTKMFGVLSRDEPVELLSQAGASGAIELVAGALIMVGLYTPWAAFLASGLMAFAYFLSHQPRGFWPIENGGEPAVLYCFVFLYFATRGSGPISLDRMLRGRDHA
jgi:putative oxidoreductase